MSARAYGAKPFLYVKHPGQGRFAPVDWKEGVQVVNRIHASMFTEEEKPLIEADMAHPQNAATRWEWRA